MKTVAVISHIWLGHIPAYHRLFVERLTSIGCQVISLAPCERAELAIGTSNSTWSHAAFGQTPSALLQSVRKSEHPTPFRAVLDRTGITLLLRRSGWPAIWRSIKLWRCTARALAVEERAVGVQADLVIIVYPASGYLENRMPESLIPSVFARQWIGIWNGPELLLEGGDRSRAGRAFLAKNCRAVLVPDPWMRDRLRGFNARLPIEVMPEIADLRPPTHDHLQIKQVTEAAKGRHIVGLLGNITKRKGIFPFVEMAKIANARGMPLFFMAAGDFSLNSCGAEYEAIASVCASAPDNFLLLPSRIDDGPEFNAYVMLSDVLFAAYIDFPFQSNLLTKAAAFGRPVVVSRGYVMEQRTADYGLGLTVPQGDAPAALEAVTELLSAGGVGKLKPRWSEYLVENSVESLDRLFAKLLVPPIVG